MKLEKSLDHEFTPDQLKSVNQQLASLFSQEQLEEAKLLSLMTERDEIVQHHLTLLNENQLRDFVEHESVVNDYLLQMVKKLFIESQTQLTALIRGKKALEKYK